MHVIEIQLKKFNNQSKQYHALQTLTTNVVKLTIVELQNRQQVEGFYLYEYTFNDQHHRIYSVSPSLFDNL